MTTKLDGGATVFRIFTGGRPESDYGDSHEAVFGDQPRTFRSRDRAEARCRELNQSGRWPGGNRPSYVVEEVPAHEYAEEV